MADQSCTNQSEGATLSCGGQIKMDAKISSVLELFSPSRKYSAEMYEEHRFVSMAMTAVTTMAGMSLWIWDYVYDPVGAQNTIWLRLLILPTVLPYFIALAMRWDYRLAYAAATITFAGWEAGFLGILSKLEGGMVYGLAGLMYFVMMPLLMTRGFSFILNALLIVCITCFPLLPALSGMLAEFQPDKYMVLIFPAATMVLFALFAFSQLHRTNWQNRRSIEKLARLDPLTGLANRRCFTSTLTAELVRSQRLQLPLSVILLDIDHFKAINDTYGHQVGDAAMQSFSAVCCSIVRNIDLVARIGGDEFAIILFDSSVDQACVIAERIRAQVEKTPVKSANGNEVSLTVSIGVSDRIRSIDDLLQAADEALYLAKRSGRNCVQQMA